MYRDGECGCPQNITKALELWHRAGELGCAEAYCNIGICYDTGRGVERNEKRANHYWELAAINGDLQARFNLGVIEAKAGNMDRALKHYMIAVNNGGYDSLQQIKRMYKFGFTSKDEYAKALRSYQAYLDEIKSDQRDKAMEFSGSSYYER